MIVRFWGTRGSVATPGLSTAHYGGNTSCVEVQTGDTEIILDAGTGIRGLGGELSSRGLPLHAHVLLTHIHWDHIQGFPFFTPLFMAGASFDVYAATGLEQGLEEALAGQMQYTYFPVQLADLPARMAFHELGEGSFNAGRVTINTQFLNHPAPTIGYRMLVGGRRVAYITDHEPFLPHDPDPSIPLQKVLLHPGDRRHVAFLQRVDLLIHDAQYIADEYPSKRGWGHSTVEYVVDVAVAAGVRQLALFHHDPWRDDAALRELVIRAQNRVQQRGGRTEVFAAAEGQVVELHERANAVKPRTFNQPSGTARPFQVLLIGASNERRALRSALVDDGYRLLDAPAGMFYLADRSRGAPDLVVVAPAPGDEPIALLQMVLAASHGVPVLVVLPDVTDSSLVAHLGEMASDVVVPPYTLPNLRSRVRACLGRAQAIDAPLQRATPPTDMDSMQTADRLPLQLLTEMLEAGMPRYYRRGDTLFQQGDPAGGVLYLHTGRARVVARGAAGQVHTVGYVGPGDTTGEMSALDGGARSATVIATQAIEATYIPREAFHRVLERSPAVALRLLRMLVRRMREIDQRLVGDLPLDEAEAEAETRAEAHAEAVRVGGAVERDDPLSSAAPTA